MRKAKEWLQSRRRPGLRTDLEWSQIVQIAQGLSQLGRLFFLPGTVRRTRKEKMEQKRLS